MARVRGRDCQRWQQAWWPTRAFGAKKGGCAWQAAADIGIDLEQNHFVTSWDYSLAFDRVLPGQVAHALRRLGMPSGLVHILEHQWTHQRRFLQYAGFAHSEVQLVGTSLPQGDPWCPLGLTAVLTAPMRQVAEDHPQVRTTLFVDDRTWSCRTLPPLVAAGRTWQEWSRVLGMVENEAKQQWAHRQPWGRAKLIDAGVSADMVSSTIDALGFQLTGGKACRGPGKKAEDRLKLATAMVSKSTYLPVPPGRRQQVLEAGPLSMVEYGWFQSSPPVDPFNKLQRKYWKALSPPRAMAVELKHLLHGHRSDVRFRAQQTTATSLARVAAKRGRTWSQDVPGDVRCGWARSIHHSLRWTGWQSAGRWLWHHPGTNSHISFDTNSVHWRRPRRLAHTLREAWRQHRWHQFTQQSRRDSTELRHVRYDPSRLKALQEYQRQEPRAVLRLCGGAMVSPACRAQGAPSLCDVCPWCRQATGTQQHVVWECTSSVFAHRPAFQPADALQRRLFWPTGQRSRAHHDRQLFEWAKYVDRTIREHRFGEGGL